MTFRNPRSIFCSLFFVLILVVAGCGSHQPVVYYNLTSLPAAQEEGQGVPAGERLAIGVGPVSFPESLSRPQIALRLDSQSLKYDDFHRWSGPLNDEFAEVLMEDLAARLPLQTNVALFPWGGYFQPTHRLIVNITQFDGQLDGEVILTGRWTIANAAGKETLVARKSTIRVKVTGPQYQDLVAAQSQAVAELSAEIVAALANR